MSPLSWMTLELDNLKIPLTSMTLRKCKLQIHGPWSAKLQIRALVERELSLDYPGILETKIEIYKVYYVISDILGILGYSGYRYPISTSNLPPLVDVGIRYRYWKPIPTPRN